MGLPVYEENSASFAEKMTTITLTEFKDYNTEKLLEFLKREEELHLIQEDFDTLEKERICGVDFLEFTMEEFRSFGMKGGPAKRLSKYTIKLKNELEEFEEKLEQIENQLDYDYTDYNKNTKKSSPPLIPNDYRALKEGAQVIGCGDDHDVNAKLDSP
ncbi:hypothetical protein RhiirC2_345703 [Rhizophagus irregularis]|uniref:SAM domain-containing protein n=1 Tax=Rhizophagus irregularis TaxID=588596 RepID=A0A2N1M929_9GLOM|nr:hypothetical protein RhiirC2_345703 [Rhizophagus irregularis]